MKRPPRTAFPPGVFVWPCGCTLDHPNEDVVCESHRHTPVVREGASLRTGDELLEQFINDAMDLLTPPVTPGGVVSTSWNVVLEACAEDHAVHGAWLGNDDVREDLEATKDHAEDQLTNAGWTVDWNDGYVIWRPTADAPAEELRRIRDMQAGL